MLRPSLLTLLLATPPHPEAAAQPTTAVDEIVYNHGGPNATNRSLGDVLRERVSVRDFGALGKCGSPDAAPPQPTEATCPDDSGVRRGVRVGDRAPQRDHRARAARQL